MNLNSRLFDSIRVKPKAEAASKPEVGRCERVGCQAAGEFRAPKGRNNEGEYWKFCLEHVREYNSTYNYFAGMDDDAVAKYQKEDLIGHRPTWSMGVNSATREAAAKAGAAEFEATDPFDILRGGGFRAEQRKAAEPETRVGPLARKAYETLDLPETTPKVEVKARFKILVKRFHPDMNGGDRSYEDKLREIINAYNTLKSSGLA
ncbi:MAG: J domain-containing protein [Beijerinckiaceae bacterium]|nr:J domain-containing protein [Beijerinckiaceae bacterium]